MQNVIFERLFKDLDDKKNGLVTEKNSFGKLIYSYCMQKQSMTPHGYHNPVEWCLNLILKGQEHNLSKNLSILGKILNDSFDLPVYYLFLKKSIDLFLDYLKKAREKSPDLAFLKNEDTLKSLSNLIEFLLEEKDENDPEIVSSFDFEDFKKCKIGFFIPKLDIESKSYFLSIDDIQDGLKMILKIEPNSELHSNSLGLSKLIDHAKHDVVEFRKKIIPSNSKTRTSDFLFDFRVLFIQDSTGGFGKFLDGLLNLFFIQ